MHQSVSGCHVLNVSPTGGCVDCNVAMVMVVLQSGCSLALFLPLMKAFFELISFNTSEEGSFLLLNNTASVFKWWSTGVVVQHSIA